MKNEGKTEELNLLAKKRAETAFVKGYEAEHCESLGLVLSTHFEWDGLVLLKVLYSALEDSNFHAENKTVLGWIEKYEKGAS